MNDLKKYPLPELLVWIHGTLQAETNESKRRLLKTLHKILIKTVGFHRQSFPERNADLDKALALFYPKSRNTVADALNFYKSLKPKPLPQKTVVKVAPVIEEVKAPLVDVTTTSAMLKPAAETVLTHVSDAPPEERKIMNAAEKKAALLEKINRLKEGKGLNEL